MSRNFTNIGQVLQSTPNPRRLSGRFFKIIPAVLKFSNNRTRFTTVILRKTIRTQSNDLLKTDRFFHDNHRIFECFSNNRNTRFLKPRKRRWLTTFESVVFQKAEPEVSNKMKQAANTELYPLLTYLLTQAAHTGMTGLSNVTARKPGRRKD